MIFRLFTMVLFLQLMPTPSYSQGVPEKKVDVDLSRQRLETPFEHAIKGDVVKQDGAYVDSEGSIWPGLAYAYWVFSKRFNVFNTTDSLGSPAATIFSFAVNDGSIADVVALLGDAIAERDGGTAFGGNLIARSAANVKDAKLVGAEIDVEPARDGNVVSGSGLYINAFNIGMPIAAIQIGGINGGRFQDGILCYAVTASCNGARRGLEAKSFIDASSGNFSDAALVLGSGQGIKFKALEGPDSVISTTHAGYLQVELNPQGIIFKRRVDGVNLVKIDGNAGVLRFESAGEVIGSSDLRLKAVTGSIVAENPIQFPQFPFASLPPPGIAGRQVFCSDCLKTNEHSGTGTGTMVIDDGHNRWVEMDGSKATH